MKLLLISATTYFSKSFGQLVPIILVLFMFYWGYVSYAKMMDPVAVLGEEGVDHIDLYVNGKQWSWDITYPGGLVINSKKIP